MNNKSKASLALPKGLPPLPPYDGELEPMGYGWEGKVGEHDGFFYAIVGDGQWWCYPADFPAAGASNVFYLRVPPKKEANDPNKDMLEDLRVIIGDANGELDREGVLERVQYLADIEKGVRALSGILKNVKGLPRP